MQGTKKMQYALAAFLPLFREETGVFSIAIVAVFALFLAAIFYIYRARTKVDSGIAHEPVALGGDMKAELDVMKNSVNELDRKLSERRNSLKKVAG